MCVGVCGCVGACLCVRVWARAHVRARVRECMRVCVRGCVCVRVSVWVCGCVHARARVVFDLPVEEGRPEGTEAFPELGRTAILGGREGVRASMNG